MNRRASIRMTDEEVQTFLQEERTLQVATIDHDGYPHLVAMWYVLMDNEIAFWTYARSQKAVNLRRDPRLTCLVEAGERYGELRGVQIKGQAQIHDDRETVQRFGEMLWARYYAQDSSVDNQAREMFLAQVPKRVGVIVKPVEVVSWDHRKLGGGY